SNVAGHSLSLSSLAKPPNPLSGTIALTISHWALNGEPAATVDEEGAPGQSLPPIQPASTVYKTPDMELSPEDAATQQLFDST
ncbi:unnamed protein product, partial [Amoebophrya sp. A25]